MSDNFDLLDYKGVWVFAEIKDHEEVDQCALELLTKGRELAGELGEELVALVLALDAEQYLDEIKKYGPDKIIYYSHLELKHYDDQIFPDLIEELINEYKPSVFLFPGTEAGYDLSARLAYRCRTGLVNDAVDVEIQNGGPGKSLLVTNKPWSGGNVISKVICASARPQMASVSLGRFEKKPLRNNKSVEVIKKEYEFDRNKLKVKIVGNPIRQDKPKTPLTDARTILGVGYGLGTEKNFQIVKKIGEMIEAEIGGTRRCCFLGWIPEHCQIGVSGVNVAPKLYIAWGISGAIQHTVGLEKAEIIIAINRDKNASIFRTSDYYVIANVEDILPRILNLLQKET